MSEKLPYAIEADVPLGNAELEVLKGRYQKELPEVTTQTKFNYAWGLVRSRRQTCNKEGIKLFYEIYNESRERRRECLYYLALGHYKVGEYRKAKEHNNQLLQLEPNNQQALSLAEVIDEKVNREGIIGAAITGVLVALGALVVGIIAKRKTLM
ncbi:8276_t:CDS:2 [Paraglomus brasilianum]|uniref:Mitochondrial fission 1 protein n=1 Tax=Paraglomus brasilianum TaxID=144538 RepID=A0A9N8ZXS2_9GLOM|nr:8276_t:CDS:2 [Paraglomus brasilianum]